jgi:hypothetical protein
VPLATNNKDFRVKNGLIVEGTTATVNGFDVLTTASEIQPKVPLGEEYPIDLNNGSLFYNVETNRLAVFHNSVWRELAYLTEVGSIFGGDSETGAFSKTYDGGDSFTQIFVGAVDGGDSGSNVPSDIATIG